MLPIASPSALGSAAATARLLAWQATLRLVVAALCIAFLLAFSQLAVNSLLAYYANIAPYTGAG